MNNRAMRQNDANHLKKVVVDERGDLIVAIEKFSWLNCLIHSVYGYISLVFLGVTVLLLVTGYHWIWVTVLGVLAVVLWAVAWLNSNDILMERVYVELLESHLINKGVITAPFISSKFYTDEDTISCITDDGKKLEYKVEYMQERKSTYVVKIHI